MNISARTSRLILGARLTALWACIYSIEVLAFALGYESLPPASFYEPNLSAEPALQRDLRMAADVINRRLARGFHDKFERLAVKHDGQYVSTEATLSLRPGDYKLIWSWIWSAFMTRKEAYCTYTFALALECQTSRSY